MVVKPRFSKNECENTLEASSKNPGHFNRYKKVASKELHADHVVRWRCPEEKMLKLNVDGAVNIDGKQVGAGGIFRNHKGRWIQDFWFYVGATEGDWAELWGLHEGLRIAVRERFCPLIIESNFLKLVQAINKGVGLYHPWRSILQDCTSMMRFLSVSFIFSEKRTLVRTVLLR
ncbi:Ribonuclease H domain [Dillenia turbinata]|uniref:Ribonuclease H domain n=1 Tax=Dillenia turbinata TaxID=194707 RepID=A0AAN8ZK63_9MAGN